MSPDSMVRSQVQIMAEYSEAMQRIMPFAVILPNGYETSKRRYPVLYFLHGGFYGSFMDFLDMADIVEFTSAREVIVVLVHGNGSWYANPYNGGKYGPPYWETYHTQELIPLVDKSYRTLARRESRAIGGSSKGGYGALCYAARYPHLFGSVSASSAPVDGPKDGLHPTIHRSHGRTSENEIFYLGHRPRELAMNLNHVDIYFSLGDGAYAEEDLERDQGIVEIGVQLEKDFRAENEAFDRTLTDLGYPHQFKIISPGYHTWKYFERQYKDQLAFHLESFSNPPSRPQEWSYKTIENEFAVWDWSFDVKREKKEFLSLRDVSPSGFEVVGSGMLRLVTAASYPSGKQHMVLHRMKASEKLIDQIRCSADDMGCLRFSISLQEEVNQTKKQSVGEMSQPDIHEIHLVQILPCT
jgi:S-formylglutathione hydrolase FrmB